MMKIRWINVIQKEMVRTLYNDGASLTISEMSQKLGRPETVVRKHALGLKQMGVLDMRSKVMQEVQTDFNNLIRLYELYENTPREERESFLNCLEPKIRQEIEVAL
ncbi:hypothetical protein HY494_03170 [Candidatus Woesearchaeota archaeon]|nr:hypothetical protein [Candidatus Woesearchaeota archaeon]